MDEMDDYQMQHFDYNFTHLYLQVKPEQGRQSTEGAAGIFQMFQRNIPFLQKFGDSQDGSPNNNGQHLFGPVSSQWSARDDKVKWTNSVFQTL